MAINKTNEELHKEFEDALKELEEKTYNLLHYGSYKFKYISRDFMTNRVNFAIMEVGKHTMTLSANDENEKNGTRVTLTFENNPINESILHEWDRQTIDNDIDYHRKQLAALRELKKTFSETSKS